MTTPALGVGATFDQGRYVVEERLSGYETRGLYRGRRTADGLPAVVAIRHHDWDRGLADPLRFDSPGVAPLLFIGPPDGYRGPSYRPMQGPLGALIEQRPCGASITEHAAPLAPREMISVGFGLLATISAAAARGIEIRGIRPETVYVVNTSSGARFAGVIPRSVRVLFWQNDPPNGSPFDGHCYESPELYDTGSPSSTSDLFSVALTLWVSHTRRHAYRVTKDGGDEYVMMQDQRDPFPGPADIGRILASILVADPARRPSVAEVEAEWVALARSWDVPRPEFPPPGLS